MKVNKTNLSMVRGDTDGFSVSIKGIDLSEEDTIELMVRKNVYSAEPMLHKVATIIENVAYFRFEPDDTEPLKFGKFVYDVQLTTSTGDVRTLIETSEFELRTEVTHE